MKNNMENHLIVYLVFFITGIFVLVAAGTPYAGNDLSALQGETGYATVKDVGSGYLKTADGRFEITKDTKIYDEEGADKELKDIKVSSMVRIAFKRVAGEIVALDVVIKKSGINTMPE